MLHDTPGMKTMMRIDYMMVTLINFHLFISPLLLKLFYFPVQ